MPIPALAFAALPAVVGAASKWLTGNSQQKKADKILAENPRVDYKTPRSITQNASLAAYLAANGKMPGIGMAENRIASGQSRTVGGAIDTQRDPASIAAVLAASQGNYNNAMNDLETKGAMYKDQNINRSMGAQNTLGQYQDKEWDWNKKQKYLSAMAAASALQHGAGMNKANALNDVTTVATSALFGNAYGKMGMIPPATSPYTGTASPYSGVPMRSAANPVNNPAAAAAQWGNPYGAQQNDPYNMYPNAMPPGAPVNPFYNKPPYTGALY